MSTHINQAYNILENSLGHNVTVKWKNDDNDYMLECKKCGVRHYGKTGNIKNVKMCKFLRAISLEEFVQAMESFIKQPPGLDSRDYARYPEAYHSDRYHIQKYRTLALEELERFKSNIAKWGADGSVIMSYFLPYVGRMEFKLDENNQYYLHYVPGQYFCTEYRHAAYDYLCALNSAYLD